MTDTFIQEEVKLQSNSDDLKNSLEILNLRVLCKKRVRYDVGNFYTENKDIYRVLMSLMLMQIHMISLRN